MEKNYNIIEKKGKKRKKKILKWGLGVLIIGLKIDVFI